MSPGRRLTGLLCAMAVGAGAVGVTACGPAAGAGEGDRPSDSTRAANAPQGPTSAKAGGGERTHRHHPLYGLLPAIEAARLVADPDPLVSDEVMLPIVNGWRVGNHLGFTVVEAGLAADNRSRTTGRFAILRYRVRHDSQTVDLVDVRGAGAVKITKAPLGPRVVTWAQHRGNLQFISSNGVKGTLHLKDDTVTLR
jgi:hypothetical protein